MHGFIVYAKSPGLFPGVFRNNKRLGRWTGFPPSEDVQFRNATGSGFHNEPEILHRLSLPPGAKAEWAEPHPESEGLANFSFKGRTTFYTACHWLLEGKEEESESEADVLPKSGFRSRD